MTVFHASAQVWIIQDVGVSGAISSIHAIDENTFWASSIPTHTEPALFLRTIDGGASWTSGAVEAETDNFFTIAAIDANTAYFVGEVASHDIFDTRIYKTGDGGANWNLQYRNAGLRSAAPSLFSTSIAFWDEMRGVVLGNSIDEGFGILTTTDGGDSWNPVRAQDIPPFLPGEQAISLTVMGDSHVWFGTGYSIASNDPVRIFRSTDRGQTWTAADTELSTAGPDGLVHGVTAIAMRDTLNGFAASTDALGEGNTLARTTDGGQTWTNVADYIQSGSQTSAIVYVPQTDFQVILAAAYGGNYYSDDDGVTWTRLSADRFSSLSFASPTTGWALSSVGLFRYNGEDLTPVAVERFSEIPQDFDIFQNYPNPFSSSTRIQFTLDRRSPVRIGVFNLLGVEVAVPVNETLGPGSHEALFEAGGLPGGVYVYRIQAGEFVQTRKLTIVR